MIRTNHTESKKRRTHVATPLVRPSSFFKLLICEQDTSLALFRCLKRARGLELGLSAPPRLPPTGELVFNQGVDVTIVDVVVADKGRVIGFERVQQMLEDDAVPGRDGAARSAHVEADVNDAGESLAASVVSLDGTAIRLLMPVPVLVSLDLAMLLVELAHSSLRYTVNEVASQSGVYATYQELNACLTVNFWLRIRYGGCGPPPGTAWGQLGLFAEALANGFHELVDG